MGGEMLSDRVPESKGSRMEDLFTVLTVSAVSEQVPYNPDPLAAVRIRPWGIIWPWTRRSNAGRPRRGFHLHSFPGSVFASGVVAVARQRALGS